MHTRNINIWTGWKQPGPLFTKLADVSLQYLMKSRSRDITCYYDRISLKFDRRLGSVAAEMPVEFQNDSKSLTQNLVASRLHEIFR